MNDHEDPTVVRRTLDSDVDEPATQIAQLVAEVEDADPTELNNLWECTDDVLEHLFSTPPADTADMRISFNYEGYRISVGQHGRVELRERGPT